MTQPEPEHPIRTEVWRRHPVRCDMVGRAMPAQLSLTDGEITPGLAKRIHRYAYDCLRDAGFHSAVDNWTVIVETNDAGDPPSERIYTVRWQNESGGYIEVVGIMTRRGWPFLNHGYDIGLD